MSQHCKKHLQNSTAALECINANNSVSSFNVMTFMYLFLSLFGCLWGKLWLSPAPPATSVFLLHWWLWGKSTALLVWSGPLVWSQRNELKHSSKKRWQAYLAKHSTSSSRSFSHTHTFHNTNLGFHRLKFWCCLYILSRHLLESRSKTKCPHREQTNEVANLIKTQTNR